ncbi:MAG TPA: ABC transporter permease [Azospirillaceae bacterium]|nr:ABC transporter permease [Azospirillaceae bacterium]
MRPTPINRVFPVLGGIALVAVFTLPLLTHAPNRLLSGRALGIEVFPPVAAALVVSGLLGVILAAVVPRVALVGALITSTAYIWGSGDCAATLAAQHPATARTAFGSGGWLLLACAWLTVAEAGRRVPLITALLAVAPPVVLIAGGWLDELSLLKEWVAKRDLFSDALLRHVRIVVTAFVPTVLLGLPLGVLAQRNEGVRAPLLTALGLIQTIPSIALFGLLIDPLSRLAAAAPWVAELGIRGVGMAPAVIALTLYSLLPVVRNTAEGLAGVPAAAVDAALGMGMTRGQIFRNVEMPLALPVVVSGLRITLVQAVGLAAVASLIGAGGLGALMFQGLFANAGDLILLGAVPILMLAVAVDTVFRLIVRLLQRRVA